VPTFDNTIFAESDCLENWQGSFDFKNFKKPKFLYKRREEGFCQDSPYCEYEVWMKVIEINFDGKQSEGNCTRIRRTDKHTKSNTNFTHRRNEIGP